uniref:Uncharacterized protein n=1 Tax=Sus scrofa TaxID=9823 RepID=A0A8D0Y114_PIG
MVLFRAFSSGVAVTNRDSFEGSTFLHSIQTLPRGLRSFLGRILGLSGERLKVAAHFQPHGFSSPKAKPGRSEWLAVDGSVGASDNRREGASSGTDWWWRNGSEGKMEQNKL